MESELEEWEARAHATGECSAEEVLRLIAEVRRLRKAAAPAGAAPTPEQRRAATDRLREMVERARAGEARIDPEAVRREVAVLRAGATVIPPKRGDDPAWREQFERLIEQIRASVPEEWSEEDLMRRVEQAVTEVRASRASGH